MVDLSWLVVLTEFLFSRLQRRRMLSRLSAGRA
jgi:hypothetical protein